MALSAQFLERAEADSEPDVDAEFDTVQCCSTVATGCCGSTAIIVNGAIAPSWLPVRSAWLAAAPDSRHGLVDEVNRRPPRLV
jgi:hypothetical protein